MTDNDRSDVHTTTEPNYMPPSVTISGQTMMLLQALDALYPGHGTTVRIWPDGVVSVVVERFADETSKPVYFNERPDALSASLVRLLKDTLTDLDITEE